MIFKFSPWIASFNMEVKMAAEVVEVAMAVHEGTVEMEAAAN